MSIYNDEPFWSNERLLTIGSHSCSEFCVCCESLRVNIFGGGWIRIVQSISILVIFGAVICYCFLSYEFEGIWNILLYFFDDSLNVILIYIKVNCNFKIFMDMLSVIRYFCSQQLLLCVIALVDDALPMYSV